MRFFTPGLVLAGLALATPVFAQQELAFTVGGLHGPDRTTRTTNQNIAFSTGTALQGNYSRYIKSYKIADLYGEVHVLFSPRQEVTSAYTAATASFTTLYVTPGVRLKFYPKKNLSPYVLGGGGYALYRQSDKTVAGLPNPAPRTVNSPAGEFGGGLDFQYSPRIAFRLEAREFFTSSVKYNVPIYGRGQYNFVVGGGVVFHLGAK